MGTKASICTEVYAPLTEYNSNNLPDYSKIVVEHAEELSIEEIESLKGFESVDLVFDVTRLLKNNQERLDVSSISGSNIKINYDSFSWMSDEVNKAILLTFLENEDETMFRESFDYQKAKEINDRLKEFSKNLNIEEFDSETRRLEKITQAIIEKITYDEDVANKRKNSENKTIEYNNKSLSSILLGDGTKTGVCINYASLATILGYMNGVELEEVHAHKNIHSSSHAWNAYVHNNSYNFIDYTLLDSCNELYRKKEIPIDVCEYDIFTEIMNHYHQTILDKYPNFINPNNKNALIPDEEKQPIIHKKNFYGDLINNINNNEKKILFALFSLIALESVILSIHGIKSSKKKKKNTNSK